MNWDCIWNYFGYGLMTIIGLVVALLMFAGFYGAVWDWRQKRKSWQKMSPAEKEYRKKVAEEVAKEKRSESLRAILALLVIAASFFVLSAFAGGIYYWLDIGSCPAPVTHNE